MYLLDTNVVSELRWPNPNRNVTNWVRTVPAEQLYLSAVTIGEIQSGVEVTREQDTAKARELETWLCRLIDSDSVLPVDAAAFRQWGKLMHRKSDTLTQDAMIAAVAVVHALTVVTRNVRDFEALGIESVNPFG